MSIETFQIKPSNILSLKIEVDESGYYSELDPQLDITPYETMLIFKLVTVMLNTTTSPDLAARFVRLNKLQRHFRKTDTPADEEDDDE